MSNILHRLFSAVVVAKGQGHVSVAEPVSGEGSANQVLNMLSHWENKQNLSVVPINNGFLICTRVYNPNGPDYIEATHVADVETLGTTIVAQLAAMRLKK